MVAHRRRNGRPPPRLEGLRLGHAAGGLGTLPGGAGIHPHHGPTGRGQGPGRRHLQPARGLQHDQGRWTAGNRSTKAVIAEAVAQLKQIYG